MQHMRVPGFGISSSWNGTDDNEHIKIAANIKIRIRELGFN